MTSRGWPAPAKLNLFLQVTGRRPDGFHELQTVFQIIDLCDSLDFEVCDDGLVKRVPGNAAVAPEEDLVVRAARLLRRRGAVEHGVRIAVHKRIPLQGGLGGGSHSAGVPTSSLSPGMKRLKFSRMSACRAPRWPSTSGRPKPSPGGPRG